MNEIGASVSNHPGEEPGNGTVRLTGEMTTQLRLRLLVLAVLAVACTGPAVSTTTTSTGVPTSTSAETTAPATTGPTSTTTAAAGCGGNQPMVEEGDAGLLPSPGSDAEQVGSITWTTTDECETFAIDFVTAESAPATTAPAASAEFLRQSAIFRVFLDVEVTAVTDQLVQSPLVDRVFVVRRPDRSLFVDLHLVQPAVGRLVVSSTPGQLLVELAPGGADYEALSAFAANVVVVTPASGPVEVPIEITGYSRNFEANTLARVTQGTDVLDEDFTTAADWVETWGEYSITLDPVGTGEAELFVGEQSAQDGSDRGILLEVELP